MAPATRRKRPHSESQSLDGIPKKAKQSPEPPASRVISLPPELIRHIHTFCDINTLRNARLGCSTWAYEVIGSFLFDRVILIPHVYFLDRFLYAFKSSRLRRQIRRLVIDERWVEQLAMLRNSDWDDSEYDYDVPAYDIHHRASPSSRYTLGQLYEKYDEGRAPTLRVMASGAFTKIFALLKSVVSVEIQCWFCPYQIDHWEDSSIGDEFGPCSPRPAAYRALLANLGIQDKWQDYDDHAICSVHDSLAAPLAKITPQLQELKLVQLDPARIDEDPIKVAGRDPVLISKVLGRVFSGISHLDISLTSEQNWPIRYWYSERTPKEIELAANLARMLRSAPNLQSLRLQAHHTLHCNLNQMYSRRAQSWGSWSPVLDCIYVLSNYFEEPGSSALPALKDLWLQNVVCTAEELEHFLTVETPNLKRLTLNNFMLLGPVEESGRGPGYWITTSRNLRTKLSLASVDFGGFLTNLDRQHWHVADIDMSSQPESVKARMVEWFLKKTSAEDACPLDVFTVVDEELGEDDEDEEDDENGMRLLRAATDSSWSMECPREESDTSDEASDCE